MPIVREELILRAAIWVAKIRDSSPNAHLLRLRYAKKLSDAIEAFIKEEARRANSKSEHDPCHLSWSQIASALEMTKSKAFRLYGGENESRVREPERND